MDAYKFITKNIYDINCHDWMGNGLPYESEYGVKGALTDKKDELDTGVKFMTDAGIFTAKQIHSALNKQGLFGQAYAACLDVQADHHMDSFGIVEEISYDVIDNINTVVAMSPEATVYRCWFPRWREVLDEFSELVLGYMYDRFLARLIRESFWAYEDIEDD